MASGITVCVRIKRDYLRAFIYSEYNLGDVGTIFASVQNDLGRLIDSLLSKTPPDYVPPVDFSEIVQFSLTYSDHKDPRVYNYLKPAAQATIEDYVNNLLCMKARMFLMDAWNKKLELKTNIFLFMEMHGIPITDTNYERIKKDFDRWRVRQKHRNLSNALSIMASVIL